MSPQSNKKPTCGQQSTFKTHDTLMSSKLEPTVWLHDSGQQIPCFGRCQLTITWMFNIKYVRCKLRLHASLDLYCISWCMAAMLHDYAAKVLIGITCNVLTPIVVKVCI